MADNDSTAVHDENELARMGYKQELKYVNPAFHTYEDGSYDVQDASWA